MTDIIIIVYIRDSHLIERLPHSFVVNHTIKCPIIKNWSYELATGDQYYELIFRFEASLKK